MATCIRQSTRTSWPFTYLSVYREMDNISGLNVRVNCMNAEVKGGELGMDDLSPPTGSCWCD